MTGINDLRNYLWFLQKAKVMAGQLSFISVEINSVGIQKLLQQLQADKAAI